MLEGKWKEGVNSSCHWGKPRVSVMKHGSGKATDSRTMKEKESRNIACNSVNQRCMREEILNKADEVMHGENRMQ